MARKKKKKNEITKDMLDDASMDMFGGKKYDDLTQQQKSDVMYGLKSAGWKEGREDSYLQQINKLVN